MIVKILRTNGDATNKQREYSKILKTQPIGVIIEVPRTNNKVGKELKKYLEEAAFKKEENYYYYKFREKKEKIYLENSGFVNEVDKLYKDAKGNIKTGKELKEEIKGVMYLIEGEKRIEEVEMEKEFPQFETPNKKQDIYEETNVFDGIEDGKEKEYYKKPNYEKTETVEKKKEKKTRTENKKTKGVFFKRIPQGLFGEFIEILKKGIQKR